MRSMEEFIDKENAVRFVDAFWSNCNFVKSGEINFELYSIFERFCQLLG